MQEKFANFGAMGTAVLASICRLSPAVVASLGMAGVGAFATFAAVAEYRAYLIALTIVALAMSYLLTYWKKWKQGWFKLPGYVVIGDEIIRNV